MSLYNAMQNRMLLQQASNTRLSANAQTILATLLASPKGEVSMLYLFSQTGLRRDLDDCLRGLVQYGFVIVTSDAVYLRKGLI